MSLFMILLLIICAIIASCILIKIILRGKLLEIDGLNGTKTENQIHHHERILGSFGEHSVSKK